MSVFNEYDKILKNENDLISKLYNSFNIISFYDYHRATHRLKTLRNDLSCLYSEIKNSQSHYDRFCKIRDNVDVSETYDLDVEADYLSGAVLSIPNIQNIILLGTIGQDYADLVKTIHTLNRDIELKKIKKCVLLTELAELEVMMETPEMKLLKKYVGANKELLEVLKNIRIAVRIVDEWLSVGLILNHRKVVNRDVFLYNEPTVSDEKDRIVYYQEKLIKKIIEGE